MTGSMIDPAAVPAATATQPAADPAAQPTATAAPAGPLPLLEEIDKRFHVLKEDGTPDVEAMARKAAKSHREAEKLLQTRKNRAPENGYDIKSAVPEGMEVDPSVFDEFKGLDLSQEQVAGVMKMLGTKVIPQLNELAANVQREHLAVKWGIDSVDSPEFKTRFNAVARWAIDTLGEEAAMRASGTAKDFLGLEAQMKLAMANGSVSVKATSPSVTDVAKARQRMNEIAGMPGYQSGRDKALQNEMTALAAQVAKAA